MDKAFSETSTFMRQSGVSKRSKSLEMKDYINFFRNTISEISGQVNNGSESEESYVIQERISLLKKEIK